MLGFSRAFCHSVWGLQSNSGGRMGRGAGYAFVMSVWMMRSASCKSWRCCSDRNESLRYTHCCREATRTFDTNFPTGRWLPGWDPQHVASNPGAALVCHRGGQSGRRGHWKSKYSTIIWYRFLDDIVCMIMYVYLYCTCFGCFFLGSCSCRELEMVNDFDQVLAVAWNSRFRSPWNPPRHKSRRIRNDVGTL